MLTGWEGYIPIAHLLQPHRYHDMATEQDGARVFGKATGTARTGMDLFFLFTARILFVICLLFLFYFFLVYRQSRQPDLCHVHFR